MQANQNKNLVCFKEITVYIVFGIKFDESFTRKASFVQIAAKLMYQNLSLFLILSHLDLLYYT